MDDMIRLQISADATGATSSVREVSTEVSQLNVDLRNAGAAGTEAGAAIAESMERAEYSTTEARHAAHLLGEEVGVKIPRALQSVLAESSTLGPALSAAFSTVAAVGFVELAKQAGEKLSEWISDTFIFTEAQKEMNAELLKGNAAIDAANKHVAALQLELQLLNTTSKSQGTSILLGLKQDEIEKTAEDIARLEDQLSPLTGRVEQGSAEFVKLSNELGVARAHMGELAAESGILSSQLDAQRVQEHAAALKKEEEYVKKLQEEFKRFGEIQKEAWEKGERELNKLATEHGNLIEEFKELTAVNESDVIPSINDETKAILKLQAAREQATHALENDMDRIINVQVLMQKGWAAFGQAAVKSLEEAGEALLQHLAIALLTDDQLKLSHARVAASAAYEAEAGIPFAGPILAPLAAAAAFAGAMAFQHGGIVPAAEYGMITPDNGNPSGTLALLHNGEMVLPQPISSMIQDQAGKASGGSGGGDIHIHALDAQSFKSFLTRNASELGAGMQHAAARGHFNVAKAHKGF